jgi:flagellar basal-body rod protein FlgG
MRALDIAATGLSAQQTNVDVISQNLANMTTTGYKMQRPEFVDLIYQNLRRTGTNTTSQDTILPTGVQVGLGVQTTAISRNTEQGTLQNTENPLDMAMQGKGYFQVELPDGSSAYTRDGTFKLSQDGELVTSEGFRVQPALTIPTEATGVSVNSSGQVEVTIQGQVDPQQVGQIEIATFINPAGLQAVGNNLFTQTPASGDPITGNAGENGFGTILQGYLENSNVNSVQEITNLIVAQRAYEMNTKVLSAADQMLQSLNQSA